MIDLTTANGKYHWKFYDNGEFICLRYEELWRDLCGDGAVLSLVQELEEAKAELRDNADYLKVIQEVVRLCNEGTHIMAELSSSPCVAIVYTKLKELELLKSQKPRSITDMFLER